MTNDNSTPDNYDDAAWTVRFEQLAADSERSYQEFLEQQENHSAVEDTPPPSSWEEWAERGSERLNAVASQYEAERAL